MLYVFNGKSFKDEKGFSKEIGLTIAQLLQTRQLYLKGDKKLNTLYKTFTSHFFQPPLTSNPIKHRKDAAKLTLYLNDNRFKNSLLGIPPFDITEQKTVICYNNRNPSAMTIEVKYLLMRLHLTGKWVTVDLLEI